MVSLQQNETFISIVRLKFPKKYWITFEERLTTKKNRKKLHTQFFPLYISFLPGSHCSGHKLDGPCMDFAHYRLVLTARCDSFFIFNSNCIRIHAAVQHSQHTVQYIRTHLIHVANVKPNRSSKILLEFYQSYFQQTLFSTILIVHWPALAQ